MSHMNFFDGDRAMKPAQRKLIIIGDNDISARQGLMFPTTGVNWIYEIISPINFLNYQCVVPAQKVLIIYNLRAVMIHVNLSSIFFSSLLMFWY